MSRQDGNLDELLSLLYPATDDEIKLITDVASKLMGEGRREYAALDLDTEPRTAADFVREAYDEGIDSLLYLGMAKGKLERTESAPRISQIPPELIAMSGVPSDCGPVEVSPDDDPSPCNDHPGPYVSKLTSLNDTKHLGIIFPWVKS